MGRRLASAFIILIVAVIAFTTCEPIALKQTITDIVERRVVLLTPDNEAQLAEKTPELTWSSLGDAASYEVQLSVTDDFADPVTGTSTEMKYETPSLTICDERYWRVRAIGADGSEGPWSETRSFEIVVSAVPTLVGTYNLRTEYPGAAPLSAAANGNVVYVPISDGLIVLDISDPAQPVKVGAYQYAPGYGVYHADTYGNYVYMSETGADGHFRMLDVTDFSHPTLAGSSPNVCQEGKVSTVGGVTVVVQDTTLQYFQTSNPSTITQDQTETLANSGWIPEFVGINCYIIVKNTGLCIYGAWTPGLIGTYSIPDIDNKYSGVSGKGNYAYISKGDIIIIDCSVPQAPVSAGAYTNTSYSFLGGMDVSGHYLFANTAEGKMAVLDITEPTSLVLTGMSDTAGGWFEVTGNYAVCPDYSTGKINIVDLVPE